MSDKFSLGPSKILQGDAIEIMKCQPLGSVDSIITSPPFNKEETVGCSDYMAWLVEFVRACRLVARDYVLMFNNSENQKAIWRQTEPTRALMWFKTGCKNTYRYNPIFVYESFASPRFNLNNGIWSDAVKMDEFALGYHPIIQSRKRHPYEDPVRLYEQLVRYLSRRKGQGFTGLILDPCFGSGTLGAACEKQGINWCGIEIDPSRVEIAKERLLSNEKLEVLA
jgi:DNA modification methylase